MKKRIGNDISVTLEITRNGEAWDISSMPVTLELFDRLGAAIPFDYQIDGNVITGVVYGKDQTTTGKVSWVLVVNAGAEDMTTIDGYAFQLVDKTSKETTSDDPVCVCCDACDSGSEIHVDTRTARDGRDGDKGDDGLSAYELAVQRGFSGSLDEWLESLKPKPTFSVGADGYLYVQ